MKKLIIKTMLLLLTAISAQGQFPLMFGDGIITHSPNSYTSSGPSTTPAVVRVIHTSNTSTATPGTNWSAPIPKPNNDYYANWDVTTLGYVFGITIDENSNPNVYVSSTQIYNSSTLNMRKVWRLNGSTGTNSLVYDFNNPSGIGTNTSSKSLGNLKYGKFGSTENIYVSDWQTGEIHRLTGSSSGSVLWANQQPFNPLFGKNNDDKTEMSYGLAIRRISSTSTKLYYAKISTNSLSSSFGGYGNNEIYSVDINPLNGDFITGTEVIANIPNINRNPESWGGYGGVGALGCVILPVIADIAFTSNGSKILVGQQSWGTFGFLAPHNSEVREFVNSPLLSSNWVNSSSSFPSGILVNQSCPPPPPPLYTPVYRQANCTGGVSYSDNVLYKNKQYKCDTSVYFSADYIQTGGTYVYGVQGMNASGGTNANSLWIDADDNTSYFDKTFLGDVEIYRNPAICTPPCQCGSWDSISLNNQSHWWVPPTLSSGSPIPTLSFNQGAVSGVLIPHYRCLGTNCNATFTYTIASHGTVTSLTSSSGALDLNQPALANLPCGHYTLCINPRCGTTNCPPLCIPFEIICLPLCACKGNVTVNANPQSLSVVSQNNTATANPVSIVSGSFTLTSTTPVTEVRMLVDEFRVIVKSGNENCRLCKNKPQTWGSINSASLSGVALQTFVTPTLTNDIREFVFNNGPNTIFNLSGSALNFNIALPGVTGLDCCNLQIEICVKIIVRDNNCCETEVLKCGVFDLK